jgi:hypothetical protein
VLHADACYHPVRHVRHTPTRVVGRPSCLASTGFELYKPKGGRELHAVCSRQTHVLGWEVVLEVNGMLSRSQVCRSQDEIPDLCQQKRGAILAAGWREPLIAGTPPK